MKILYLDLETTGLDSIQDQILEIGLLYDDLIKPLDEAPRLALCLKHERLSGHPKAFVMNARLIKRIENNDPTLRIIYPHQAVNLINEWLHRTVEPKVEEDYKLVIGGKNVQGFDIPFLAGLPGVTKKGTLGGWTFRHRVIDPGSLYCKPLVDKEPPNTEECCKRAGIPYEPYHRALYDCEIVAQLVRIAYDIK